MRIDLHTHSRASDGTDTPAGLVRAAADAGIDVLAITDRVPDHGVAPPPSSQNIRSDVAAAARNSSTSVTRSPGSWR